MKTNVVNYTPIPAQVPRSLAIEILHSHGEIITLNPLVLEYHAIKPPRDAPNDEYYSTWYEITERIKIVPGLGNMGSSKVSFKGVFHDMPWGIQTHMYVPLGIELRHKWQVRGNQPGEPPEPREIGSKAPSIGLYLQENVEITCNALATSFVKKELKAASKIMIERMMKKAELIDSGALQAMFEDGKLKTVNPADRSSTYNLPSPNITHPEWRRTKSTVSSTSRTSSYGGYGAPSTNAYGVPNPDGPGIAIEMLGDTHYAPELQPNADNNSNRQSRHSELAGDSYSPVDNSRRVSYISSSDGHSPSSGPSRPSSYHPSPGGYQQHPANGASELAAPRPTSQQPPLNPYQHNPTQPPSLGGPNSPQPWQQRYNPQDYARTSGARYA